jgi:hypothetical protein
MFCQYDVEFGEELLQLNIDRVCGSGSAECDTIQRGGLFFNEIYYKLTLTLQ